MHVLAPRPSQPRIPIFFNVDASVGQGGANTNWDDILLMQFLVYKVGDTATPNITPDRKARMLKVRATGVCDDDTIDGIRAAQEHIRLGIPGTVVDGRVSPARGYDYGGGTWILVFLCMQLRLKFPSLWPRLQDLADCPPRLKTRLAEVL